jgi:tetratricopeptide (TPR) repeat protein
MTTTLDDPLKTARRAVHAGQFRDAWDDLARQPDPVRRSPEWYLLAAMARWRLGEFGPSRTAGLQARDTYRSLGDVDGEMRAENIAAAGAFALGHLADAEAGFGRALELAERLSDELMVARCANNLGNVAFYLAADTAALGYYRLAGARFERVGHRHGLTETLINTGIVWRDLDRLADSQEAAERALEIAEVIGNRRLLAQALAMRGEALGLGGDVPLGRAQVERALGLAREQEDRLAEVEALRILCNLEREARNYPRAEGLAGEALAIASALAHPWTIATVEQDLGELLARVGRPTDAAEAFAAAAASYDAIGAATRADRVRARAVSLSRPLAPP